MYSCTDSLATNKDADRAKARLDKGQNHQYFLALLSVNNPPVTETPGSQDSGGEERYPGAKEVRQT